MKKINKIITLISCLALIFSVLPVIADKIESIEGSDVEITVIGTLKDDIEEEKDYSLKRVGIVVLKIDKTIDDLKSYYDVSGYDVDVSEFLEYYDETLSDKTGRYEFKFLMDSRSASGDYKIYVHGDKGVMLSSILRYIPLVKKTEAVKAINSSYSLGIEDLNSKLNKYNFVLSLFVDNNELKTKYEKIKNNQGFFDIMKSLGNYNDSAEQVNDSIVKLNNNLTIAVVLNSIENTNDTAVLESLLIDYKDNLGFVLTGINDDNKEFILENISRLTGIKSSDNINNCIFDSLFLYNIINAKKWGEVKTTIEKYASHYKMDISKQNINYNGVYHDMYNKIGEYKSKEQIIESFNDLKIIHTDKPKEPTPNIKNVGNHGGGVASTLKPDKVENESNTDNNSIILSFIDVSKDFWAYNAIEDLSQKGIMKGKSKENFAPDDMITREEFVAILMRVFRCEDGEADLEFTDVNKNEWYYGHISKAFELGIISGYSNKSFGIGNNITRQDMAVIAYKTIKNLDYSLNNMQEKSIFNDENIISSYAKEAIYNMQQAKIISGYGNNIFAPSDFASRAEAAQIIFALVNNTKMQ